MCLSVWLGPTCRWLRNRLCSCEIERVAAMKSSVARHGEDGAHKVAFAYSTRLHCGTRPRALAVAAEWDALLLHSSFTYQPVCCSNRPQRSNRPQPVWCSNRPQRRPPFHRCCMHGMRLVSWQRGKATQVFSYLLEEVLLADFIAEAICVALSKESALWGTFVLVGF